MDLIKKYRWNENKEINFWCTHFVVWVANFAAFGKVWHGKVQNEKCRKWTKLFVAQNKLWSPKMASHEKCLVFACVFSSSLPKDDIALILHPFCVNSFFFWIIATKYCILVNLTLFFVFSSFLDVSWIFWINLLKLEHGNNRRNLLNIY